MSTQQRPWAIVLAGGSGSRLETLTTGGDGRPVPKQFCSLRGGRSLLGDALTRAERVVDADRVVAIVAAEHKRFWEPELAALAPRNVIAQPRNRGTAAGILLPLLSILERDPAAHVVLLPSDHHVESEAVLAVAINVALQSIRSEPDRVILLGITPDAPTSDYGWIVPVGGASKLQAVERFIEKPEPAVARRLMDVGGLWNSFLIVGRGRSFLDLYARRLPRLLSALAVVAKIPADERPAALEALYQAMPTADFSRDVLQGSEQRLDVLEVPPCGWTDLGTPGRVADCLHETVGVRASTDSSGRSVPVLHRALEALELATHARTR
jgi:mannose-1-phosphate guanylyltransferase